MTLLGEQAELASTGKHQGVLQQQMLAHVLCGQRHTVSGLLTTLGLQHQDWSAAYRLYEQHVDGPTLLLPVLDGVLALLPADGPLVVAVDDTYVKKTGKHISGTGWFKDPLGPSFHVNLLYGQRFLQLSAAVPDPANHKRSRMIPAALRLIAKTPKPRKDALPEEWQDYEQRKAANRITHHAQQLIRELRQHLDARGQVARPLWVCGDGGYSNGILLTALPARVRYIGRCRADLELRSPTDPTAPRGVGRPRAYGPKLPKPKQLRADPAIPWQQVEIFNGTSNTRVRYKHIPKAKWAAAHARTTVQVVVIGRMRKRPRPQGGWTYTPPATLICSDVSVPVAELIQAYFWRWGIETNFKDEKQLFGLGHAQVRLPSSVGNAPAEAVATYAALLLASLQVHDVHHQPTLFAPPKWYRRKPRERLTTAALMRQARHDLLFAALGHLMPLASAPSSKPTATKSAA